MEQILELENITPQNSNKKHFESSNNENRNLTNRIGKSVSLSQRVEKLIEKNFNFDNKMTENEIYLKNTLLDIIWQYVLINQQYKDILGILPNIYLKEKYQDFLLYQNIIEDSSDEIKQLIYKIQSNKDQETNNYLQLIQTANEIKTNLQQVETQSILSKQNEQQQQQLLHEKQIMKNQQEEQIKEIEQRIIDNQIIKGELTNQLSQERLIFEQQTQQWKQHEKFYATLIEDIWDKHNKIQNKKGNIRVYIRIKPLSIDSCSIINQNTQKKLSLKVPEKLLKSNNQIKQYEYQFENIFGQQSSQEDIFEELQPLLLNVVDGLNVSIFAYGPTGTGKTFTMMGDGTTTNRGLAPWMIERIFFLIKKRENEGVFESSIFLEMFEIYNEKIWSLVDSSEEIQQQRVSNIKEAYNYLEKAIEQRVTKKTMKNNTSSRSHLIFKMHVNTKTLLNGKNHQGTLVLVDLAGSERVNESKTQDEAFKETTAINKSLSCLGEVMNSLLQKDQYIPFRNSKLTMLLQEYLLNDAKAMMIVNLSSDERDYQQTLQTLKFASSVKQVEGLTKLNK